MYTKKVYAFILQLHDIPLYMYGKGLPIGNMTSQFLAIYYLYKLDHFIVHNLHIKYMIRYMDDYILISNDKDYLKKCCEIINNKLINEYKLELSRNKCKIYNSNVGFDFLGYKYRVINNKTIVKVSKKSFISLKKNVKKIKYNNDNFTYNFNVLNNYYNSFKYGDSLFVKRYVNYSLNK